MKPMTHTLRLKIKMAIKNNLDISDLIENVDIKGENLSNAIIQRFNRTSQNMSRTNFSCASIGKKGTITNLSNNKFFDCNFSETKFLGIVYLRRCDCSGSNFSGAECHNVEYQHSIFKNCNFCEAIFRLGSDYGYKAKFDKNLFQDLAKHWNIEIIVKED